MADHSSTSSTFISLRKLKTWFPIRSGVFNRIGGHVKAVDGVDLDICRGEVLGLVSVSGCGKTAMGKSLLQLVKSTAGQIVYHPDSADEKSVSLPSLSSDELTPYRRKLQVVFQNPNSSLNPAFTIFGSLENPLKQCGIKTRAER